MKESSNNDRTKKAMLFLRTGGATVGESYQVSIIDHEDVFDTTAVGNVFIADGDHGKEILEPRSVNFNWKSNDTLEILYDKDLRTFLQKKEIDGVNVVYKTE